MSNFVTIHCDVYWKYDKVGRLDIENGVLIRNESYTDNFILHPFPRSKTLDAILSALKNRVICEERCDTGMLKAIGVSRYNVYDILRKTHGVDSDDYTWFKFDDDPESLSWRDLMPPSRINER